MLTRQPVHRLSIGASQTISAYLPTGLAMAYTTVLMDPMKSFAVDFI